MQNKTKPNQNEIKYIEKKFEKVKQLLRKVTRSVELNYNL